MSNDSIRIVYAGTPEFAAKALEAILEKNYHVVAVYSQPDRPSGRGRKLTPSPVKQVALDHNIEVYQPVNFKEEGAKEQLQALKPDLMIVAAYGLILPKAVLEIPTLGCINIHASLLPRWRGAAPIQRAIQAGDKDTGITIMQMDVGLDTGDMLLTRSIPIDDDDTGGTLHDKLADLGAESILAYLEQRQSSTIQPVKQDDSQANYAHKLSKEESNIDWTGCSKEIARAIRAFNPWPVAYTEDQGERVRILAATHDSEASNSRPGTILSRTKDGITVKCGQGSLKVLQLQLPGSKALSVSEFINGGKPFLELGSVLGQHDE